MLGWGCTVPEAWLERPSLEYQHALDLLAAGLQRGGGPVAVFASSRFYARDLVKRLAACSGALLAPGGWASPADDLVSLLGPEVVGTAFRLAFGIDDLPHAPAAAWAEPEAEGGDQVLAQVGAWLPAGGRLYVVSSGRLARYLPEWHGSGERPAVRPASLRLLRQWLRRSGWGIEALYGFHAPTSVVWGHASRLMERLHRPDLADRCQFQTRAGYVGRGQWAFLAPVRVMTAKRSATG